MSYVSLEKFYFHQIEGVEFIYGSHGQTFLSTLYIIDTVRT